MKKFMAIYKKELNVFFTMPVAYVVITVFVFLSGFFFKSIAEYYAQMSQMGMNPFYRQQMNLSMVEGVFRPYFQNLIIVLMLMMPLLTMRLFAEEKREGTVELLFTYPVSDFTVIMGKFASAMTAFLVMILLGPVATTAAFATIAQFDILPVLSGFLGLILLGAAFIMMGIFISTTTDSQVVAGVITFGALLFFFVISWAAKSANPVIAKILTNLSIIVHFDNFAKGLIDLTDIMYYVNLCVLFFFLSLRVLETKQWRG